MILYKTKYFGFLSDRVYKAIKESKLDPSKIEKMETNALFRQGKRMPLTSKRTKENIEKEYELLKQRISDEKDKQFDSIMDKYNRLTDHHKKIIDDYVKQQTKLNPAYKKYNDRYLDELEERFSKIRNKQNRYDLDRWNKADSKSWELRDELDDKRDKILEQLKDEWFKNKKLSNNDEIRDAKYGFERSFVPILFGSDDALLNFWEKQGKNTSKLKNTKKIYENIKENATTPIVEESEKGKGFYSFNDKKVHLSEEKQNPYTTYHELEHARRHALKKSVKSPEDFGGYRFYLANPESTLDWKRYVEEEEGAASRAGFVNTFKNRETGGADWRNAHRGFRGSMGSYNSVAGIDIDKHGILNQDYNMPPRVLEKFKENARKAGIDLSKSAKIQYKKATPEERKEIEKYVNELYNKN